METEFFKISGTFLYQPLVWLKKVVLKKEHVQNQITNLLDRALAFRVLFSIISLVNLVIYGERF